MKKWLAIRWTVLVHNLQLSEHAKARRVGDALYVAQRTMQGAYRVKTAEWNPNDGGSLGTEGAVSDIGVDMEFAGACPVQGYGIVDGRRAYYRSRGEGWQLHIAKTPNGDPLDDDGWNYQERRYFAPDGGWVAPNVTRECIRRAVRRWRSEGRP